MWNYIFGRYVHTQSFFLHEKFNDFYFRIYLWPLQLNLSTSTNKYVVDFCIFSVCQIFDPSLVKKKKKKKSPFDLDGALGESGVDNADNDEKEDASKDAGNDFDENLDLESFGKKKKKKKKPFNLDELENNLPVESDDRKGEDGGEGGADEGGNVEDELDLDVDFSKTKKKKKKKKELDELVAEKIDAADEGQKENGNYYDWFQTNIIH